MRRWWLPALAVTLLFAPVWLTLSWTVPGGWAAALEDTTSTRDGVPLEVAFAPATGDPRTGGMPITIPDAAWLREVDTLAVLVATYETAPQLVRARLSAADGSCEFVADEGTPIPNNGMLVLQRAHCNPAGSTRDFMLWVRVGEVGRVAVWTFPTSLDSTDRMLVSAPDGSAHFAVRGEAQHAGTDEDVRRVTLIAFLWQRDASTIWFWMLVLGAVGSLGAGLVASSSGWRVATGIGALTLAVAGTWALVVPPLQGADEPDHLLSFAEVTGATHIERDLEWLARRTHFERLRFRGDQQFRPADRTRPYDPAWTGDIHAERMDQRSVVAIWLWQVMAAVGVRDLPLPNALLAIRLMNALLVGLVATVAVAFVWWAAHGRVGLWSIAGLALVPTLPYFATMVSDWAFVASWSVWLATAVVVMQHDGARASSAGLLLALAFGLLLGTSISALAIAPLVVILLVARVLLGSGRAHPADALVFWGGTAVGTVAAIVITRPLFLAGFARYDAAGRGADMLQQVNDLVALVAGAPWLLLLPVAVLCLLELAANRLSLMTRMRGVLTGTGRGVALLLMAAVAIIWVVSPPVSLPTVDTLDTGTYTSARGYVADVLATVTTAGRLTGFDHLTYTSFVSGFGWIDAILPTWMLAMIATTAVGAFVIAVWTGHLRHEHRRLTWMVVGMAAVLTAIAAFASAGYIMNRNLHGRYMLTAGLIGLAVMGTGAGRSLAIAPSRLRAAVVLLLCAIHGFSLAWVTARYL